MIYTGLYLEHCTYRLIEYIILCVWAARVQDDGFSYFTRVDAPICYSVPYIFYKWCLDINCHKGGDAAIFCLMLQAFSLSHFNLEHIPVFQTHCPSQRIIWVTVILLPVIKTKQDMKGKKMKNAQIVGVKMPESVKASTEENVRRAVLLSTCWPLCTATSTGFVKLWTRPFHFKSQAVF